MVFPSARVRLALGLLLASIVTQPLAAQGLGASAGLGLYRSNSTASYADDPGFGAELRGHWSLSSGFQLGLGARGIRFQNGDRLTAFLDGRYAPVPSESQRIRPILGVRAGPFLDGTQSDLLAGLDFGAVAGFSFRLGKGVSLTLTGDLGFSFASGDYNNFTHSFLPGLMLGLTFH
jgi:hypothetical protein